VIDVSDRHKINRFGLAAVSLAIALICAGLLALLVRDRWNRPEIKAADEARYATTGQAAQAVGGRVLPTDPKLAVEPAPAGPKQAQPANPN
jgi:Flp pilus assembly protein CpaB